jgi:hypothetical protein
VNESPPRKPHPSDSVAESAGKSAPEPAGSDVMFIHGVSEDGQNLAVLRAREGRVEAGVVRQARDGEPITGELLSLTPRAESPLLCDVKVELAAPGTAAHAAPAAKALGHGGPAQVATRRYRQNWDAIFRRDDKKSAPN